MNVRCRLALSIDILKFIRVFEGHCKEESGGGGGGRKRGGLLLPLSQLPPL